MKTDRVVQIGYTSQDVKNALRKRHPGERVGTFVGRWTCLEEWIGIDLLALDAWQSASVVGYEVKVSRSDMRSELLNPGKRMEAVSRCTEFYFAVPVGMLKKDELTFVEPDWTFDDYEREVCDNPDCRTRYRRRGFARNYAKPRGPKFKGTEHEGVTINLGYGRDTGELPGGGTYTHHYEITACCNVCKGYGTKSKSKVELEAPQLWVPKDVGLIEIDGRGATVTKPAPRNKTPKPIVGTVSPNLDETVRNRMSRQAINDLVRWASNRPDPRHR